MFNLSPFRKLLEMLHFKKNYQMLSQFFKAHPKSDQIKRVKATYARRNVSPHFQGYKMISQFFAVKQE